MTLKDAINVVEQALEIARKAGVYSFGDSAMIFSAMSVLSPLKNQEEKQNENPEVQAPDPAKGKKGNK